jgi:ABC-type polysaccharide/polyol phosphate export permease
MSAILTTAAPPRAIVPPTPSGPSSMSALLTLSRRRFALSVRTPREIIVPLVNPLFFALIIAPALAAVVGRYRAGFDYFTFVAIATIGLLVPINCMFAGIGVIVDRQSGARRDLLAAPIRRSLLVLGNFSVALTVTGLQVVVVVVAAALRGATYQLSVGGVLWFVAAATLLAIGMYGVAETLANRSATQEAYVGVIPAVGILPYFFAGSLFPISVLPGALAAFAKVLPLTHALALMRYGLAGQQATGLHQIWGDGDPTALALRSLAVLVVFAAGFVVLAIRVFSRSAVR